MNFGVDDVFHKVARIKTIAGLSMSLKFVFSFLITISLARHANSSRFVSCKLFKVNFCHEVDKSSLTH